MESFWGTFRHWRQDGHSHQSHPHVVYVHFTSYPGSHVMKALRKTDQFVTVRFSFSKYNTKEEVDRVVEKVKELL